MSIAYHDIDQLIGNDEVAQALGNMIVAWAAAESAVLYAMCAVCSMHPNQAHYGYYRIPTFEARVNFITAMIPEWPTSKYDKDAIAVAIGRIKDLSLTRNNWVHNVWSVGDDKELVVFNFRAKEDKGRRKAVKGSDINQHSTLLRQRTRELRKLISDIPP